MAEQTNAQVALLAAVQVSRTDRTEFTSDTVARAAAFLAFLNRNTGVQDA